MLFSLDLDDVGKLYKVKVKYKNVERKFGNRVFHRFGQVELGLICIWWINFSLKPILDTIPAWLAAGSKSVACFKSCQN